MLPKDRTDSVWDHVLGTEFLWLPDQKDGNTKLCKVVEFLQTQIDQFYDLTLDVQK